MQSRVWKYSKKNCCTEAKNLKDFGSMGPHFSLWTLFHTKSYKRIFDKSKTLYQSIIYKYIIYTSLLSCQILLSPINRQILLQFTCFSQTDSKEGYKSGKILSFQQQKTAYSPWYLPDNGSIRENVAPWTLRIKPEHILWPIRAEITHKNQKKERKSQGSANKK